MLIEAIIFDIGGVILWGSVPVFLPCTSALLTVGTTQAWHEWDAGIIDVGILVKKLVDQYGQEQEVHYLLDRILDPDRPMIPETVEVIRLLKKKGYKLYILSNFSWDAYYQFIPKRTLFFSQFDGIVCSCFIKSTKPDPAPYRYLLTQYKLDPAKTLFIDDSQENIQTAQELGLEVFLFDKATLYQELVRRKILP